MKDLKEKNFLAAEWLFLLRFGLPILEDLSQNIDHFNLLCRTYLYCLEILSPSHYSNRLVQLDKFYHNLAKDLPHTFYPNKDHCDLNFHIPTHYVELIKRWGPPVSYWCWGMERQNQVNKVMKNLFFIFLFFFQK